MILINKVKDKIIYELSIFINVVIEKNGERD